MLEVAFINFFSLYYTVWFGYIFMATVTDESSLYNIYPTRNLTSHFSILYYSDLTKTTWNVKAELLILQLLYINTYKHMHARFYIYYIYIYIEKIYIFIYIYIYIEQKRWGCRLIKNQFSQLVSAYGRFQVYIYMIYVNYINIIYNIYNIHI